MARSVAESMAQFNSVEAQTERERRWQEKFDVEEQRMAELSDGIDGSGGIGLPIHSRLHIRGF